MDSGHTASTSGSAGTKIEKSLKNFPMGTMSKGDSRDTEANSPRSSEYPRDSPESENAQAGVKNIEAVSLTWTKWGLIAAYIRYVVAIVLYNNSEYSSC